MKVPVNDLKSILSPTAIYSWEDIEVTHRERIAKAIAPGRYPSCIVYPQTVAELAEAIAYANDQNWRVLPCGSGTKLSWGGIATDIDLVVSTERLNQLIEHAVGDLTVTVEAGMKFATLQEILTATGQFLALDPTMPESATIGGIIATTDTNSLRQRYGSIRDQLLGITFVRADGQIAKAGGRVVKNVAGYDLMKLFTGSYGTLGIMTAVTLRVYPIPEASETVVLTGEADAIAQATSILRASALTPTAADLLSTQLVSTLELGNQVGLVTRFQSLNASVKEQSAQILAVGQKLGLKGTTYSATDEADLWQKLREQIHNIKHETAVTCRIGVLPTAAVATLNQLEKFASQSGKGLIHTSSGLGLIQFDSQEVKIETILQMRTFCQSQAGFLSIIEAPNSFKQQIDVWGYSGNALDLMRQIKKQFDLKNMLSPGRFVGGI